MVLWLVCSSLDLAVLVLSPGQGYYAYLLTLPVFPGVSKFFIKSPGDFWGLFLDIVFNDILKMQRFVDISRFVYSGGWLVGMLCIMVLGKTSVKDTC